MATRKIYKWEELFYEVNLNEVYTNLDNTENIDIYSNDCENVVHLKGSYPEVYSLCKTFARNFKKLSNILHSSSYDRNDRCAYLNIWLFNQLNQIVNNYKELKNKENIVSKFIEIWYNINAAITIQRKCAHEYVSTISLDEWTEFKDLYDYFKYYNNLKRLIISEVTSKKYCPYVIHINKIYTKYKSECDKNYSVKCPTIFKYKESFKKCEPLEKLECNGFQEATSSLQTDHSHAQQGKLTHSDHGSSTTTHEGNKNQDHTDVSESKISDIHIFIIFLFSSFTIIIVSLFLYKMTPLGSRLHRKLLKKNKIKRMIDEENIHEILQNSTEYPGINFDDTSYNLTYQSH
ncbi:PIR Superfamily Protein [Plasmodium ovale curtisi]|uniref:PIR Superfamily Protein n=1 Tax=Plasmodium ovale curtisi TaxID=864141 RepID=A0A1A8X4D5_PLAOA|nr:PIR Superfamily Protein [Plasmodium ovale curtisi]